MIKQFEELKAAALAATSAPWIVGAEDRRKNGSALQCGCLEVKNKFQRNRGDYNYR